MLGNLGKTDATGRQARIGHHGRHLRISRTGGVSLRHAVRAGRVGLAVNSRHGLRLSSALGRGTQVATQNGRFILRGRYGKGPLKFNLSKSGGSASLASQVGRLNLTHPARSSAKLFGVQVRGRKAASINAVVLGATALVALVRMATVLGIIVAKGLAWLLATLLAATQQLIAGWQAARDQRAFQKQHAAIRQCASALNPACLPDDASRLRLLGHALLRLGAADGDRLQAGLETIGATLRSKRQAALLQALAEPIRLADETTDQMDHPRLQAWCLLAAELLFEAAGEDSVLEQFLALDDLCLASGDKTEAQEQLLGLIAEAGGLRLTATSDSDDLLLDTPGTRRPTPARLVAPFLRAVSSQPAPQPGAGADQG